MVTCGIGVSVGGIYQGRRNVLWATLLKIGSVVSTIALLAAIIHRDAWFKGEDFDRGGFVMLLQLSRRIVCQHCAMVVASLFAVLPIARAQMAGSPASIEEYNPREVAMLPPYCKHTQVFRERVPGGGNAAEINRWSSLLGPEFHHLHHYCWGLTAMNRGVLFATSPVERTRYFRQAVSEFNYIIERSRQDFVLLPEVLAKRGDCLLRTDRATEGVADLQQATEIKPDYWPPYVTLSDYYKSIKNIAKAREWAERGLQAAPGTRVLEQRLADLGRKQ